MCHLWAKKSNLDHICLLTLLFWEEWQSGHCNSQRMIPAKRPHLPKKGPVHLLATNGPFTTYTFTAEASGATLRHLNWLLVSRSSGSLPVKSRHTESNANAQRTVGALPSPFQRSHSGNAQCEIHKSRCCCCTARCTVSDGNLARFKFPAQMLVLM